MGWDGEGERGGGGSTWSEGCVSMEAVQGYGRKWWPTAWLVLTMALLTTYRLAEVLGRARQRADPAADLLLCRWQRAARLAAPRDGRRRAAQREQPQSLAQREGDHEGCLHRPRPRCDREEELRRGGVGVGGRGWQGRGWRAGGVSVDGVKACSGWRRWRWCGGGVLEPTSRLERRQPRAEA